MRFLNLVQRYHPAIGGSEKYIKWLSESLANEGHKVTVLTTSAYDVDALWSKEFRHIEKGNEIINSVQVRRIKLRYLPFHGKSMALLSLVPIFNLKCRFSMPGPLMPSLSEVAKLAGDYDIVHATALPFTSILWSAWNLAKSGKKPLVVTPFMHIAMPDRFGYGYQKEYQIELLRRADAVIVQTTLEKNILQKLGVPSEKLHLVGIGVKSEGYKGDAERFRKKHKLPEPIVFNVSARTYDKGAVHLLEAMKILWSKGIKAHLVMAGPARPDFIEYMRKQSADVKKYIIDLGIIEEQEKADLFSAGDVFCMPSRSESFGIVYIESWLSGSAVVGADAGAVSEIIQHEVDGLLVKFGDVKAIAQALEKLITDKSFRDKLAEAGKSKALLNYQWEDKFARLKEIFYALAKTL